MLVTESTRGEQGNGSKQPHPVRAAAVAEEAGSGAVGWSDSAPYANPGDRVLVLGSGDGSLCFSLAQVVGKRGQVVGIEADSVLLRSARDAAPGAFRRLGFGNVAFGCASYDDLRIDREAVDERLHSNPIGNERDLREFQASISRAQAAQPLVPDGAADLVVFDATIPSLHSAPSLTTFREIHRVLTPGGRCVLALVTTDEEAPEQGTNAGPYNRVPLESRVFEDLESAGLYGMSLLARDEEPFARADDTQFRRMRLVAYKGKEGPCWERVQAVLFKGPFSQATDDDGHVFARGVRTAVCEKTFRILSRPPYNTFFEMIEPEVATSSDKRTPFPCASAPVIRRAIETKTGHSELNAEGLARKTAKTCC